MFLTHKISKDFSLSEHIVVHKGDCLDMLKEIPDGSIQLIVSSPPYNIEWQRRTCYAVDINGD